MTTSLDEELQPYRFLRVDYYKKKFSFSNDDTCVEGLRGQGGYVFFTRHIGRDRLILRKTNDNCSVFLHLLWCPTDSLKESKHADQLCSESVCGGRNWQTQSMPAKKGATVAMRQKDNGIEVCVSDPLTTHLVAVDVHADAKILAAVFCGGPGYGHETKFQILTDGSMITMELSALKSQMQQVTTEVTQQMQQVIHKLAKSEQLAVATDTLKEQVTSLDAQLTERNQQTLSMQQKIKEQEDEIRELQQQMQAKVGNAAATTEITSCSAWLSNESVVMDGSVMRRIGSICGKNYIFCKTSFDVGSSITFAVKEVNQQFVESLTFGVTVYPPPI